MINIPEELYSELINYLSTKPYREVMRIMNGLLKAKVDSEMQSIGEKNDTKSDTKNNTK